MGKEVKVTDEVRLQVLKRANEILETPHGYVRGRWVSNRHGFGTRLRDAFGIRGTQEHEAYEVGRRNAANSPNEQAIACCIEGACYVASGELGLSFNEARDLIRETIDVVAYEQEIEKLYAAGGLSDEDFAYRKAKLAEGYVPSSQAMHVNDTRGKKVTLELMSDAISRLRETEARKDAGEFELTASETKSTIDDR